MLKVLTQNYLLMALITIFIIYLLWRLTDNTSGIGTQTNATIFITFLALSFFICEVIKSTLIYSSINIFFF
jgi:hypothetical protein